MFELLKTTGKELFACQSAVRDFSGILKTVGGEKEQERARYVVLGSVYMYHVHCEFIKKKNNMQCNSDFKSMYLYTVLYSSKF